MILFCSIMVIMPVLNNAGIFLRLSENTITVFLFYINGF